MAKHNWHLSNLVAFIATIQVLGGYQPYSFSSPALVLVALYALPRSYLLPWLGLFNISTQAVNLRGHQE